MIKSNLNQYNIIEGAENMNLATNVVGSYFDQQHAKFVQLTDDVSNNIHEYKELRKEMNEVEDTFETITVKNSDITYSVNGTLFDGRINLVDINFSTPYNPKNHIVEISSPTHLANSYNHVYIEDDVLYVKGRIDENKSISIQLVLYTKKLDRNYLYPGNEHPISDDRYNVSKAMSDDTELLIQQTKQVGMLGVITTCVLGVGLYVLSRK